MQQQIYQLEKSNSGLKGENQQLKSQIKDNIQEINYPLQPIPVSIKKSEGIQSQVTTTRGFDKIIAKKQKDENEQHFNNFKKKKSLDLFEELQKK